MSKLPLSTKLLGLTLLILLSISGYLYWQKLPKPSSNNSDSKTESSEGLTLPVPLTNKNIQGAYVHYFFTGTIKSLAPAGDNTDLVLEGADTDLPTFTITDKTRLHTIKPPYGSENAVNIKTSDLKTGLVVDISAEYDLKNKIWLLRDVFVPEDRNPKP